jgi:hypothetical protein
MTPAIVTWADTKQCMINTGYSGNGTSWSGNSYANSYSGRRGTLSYAAERLGNQQAVDALDWYLAPEQADANGNTDDYQRQDPAFFIGGPLKGKLRRGRLGQKSGPPLPHYPDER